MWLEAPVVERSGGQGGGSTASRPKKGTPQGGVASPLLANLYLHWFDALFYGSQRPGRRADVKLVRYADDCAPRAQRAEEGPMCNCLIDEGRPLGTGLQEQVPNHLRRL